MRLVPRPNSKLCDTYKTSNWRANDVRMSPRAATTDPHKHVNDTEEISQSFNEATAQKNMDADAKEPTQATNKNNAFIIIDSIQKDESTTTYAYCTCPGINRLIAIISFALQLASRPCCSTTSEKGRTATGKVDRNGNGC